MLENFANYTHHCNLQSEKQPLHSCSFITKFRSECFQNMKLNHKGQGTMNNVSFVVNYTGSKKKKKKKKKKENIKKKKKCVCGEI